MATSAELLLDTSAAVPFLVSDHVAHRATFDALRDKRLGLAGHSAFETYSVLTRLPDPRRMSPRGAARMVEQSFPHTVHLSAARAAKLMAELADVSIAGGAVYDALVAMAAVDHQLPLATRDRRALRTYSAFDVEVLLLD